MADTRRRIVEAAIELHQTVGPARTSISDVAARAGVQRQTYYRHFADDRALFTACTGLYLERAPLPDPEAWRETHGAEARLRRGLSELYVYYSANEPMLANVIRDAEVSPLVREMIDGGLASAVVAMGEVLAAGFPGDSARPCAAVHLALDFNTWRTLVRRSALSEDEAVELMVSFVLCASR
jgi:AcrR family transcriptional regulator